MWSHRTKQDPYLIIDIKTDFSLKDFRMKPKIVGA